MVLLYKYKDDVSTKITVDYKTETVQIENYTDNMIYRAFGVREHPTFADYEQFLEDRCFPRTRDNLKMHLRELGLDFYDPLEIVKKTQGRLLGDNMWIEFVEE